MQHQEHYNRKFYLDKRTGYWISTDYPRIRAHVWVWQYHHGKPPKNFHIHHINGNKSNNDISNLRLLSPKDHVQEHLTDERRKKSRERMPLLQELAKVWHKSPEGHAWHKEHGKNFGNFEPRELSCLVCASNFLTKKLSTTKFCSNACKSAHRRNSGIDNVKFVCKECNCEFYRNKYAPKRTFCSKKCSMRDRVRKN